MIDTVIGIVMGMLLLALAMAGWRLLRGPAVEDRILAIDTMYINTIALLMVLGMWLRSGIYFEAILVIAMLGFVGTLALTRYAMRRDIIE